MPKGHPNNDEAGLTELYADRKVRKAREKAAREAASIAPRRGGRPMVIEPGSEIENRFKSMWALGTQYKVMAEDLGVSIKALKNARLRLKLATRRPEIMLGVDIRVRLTGPQHRALKALAQRKGATFSQYVRNVLVAHAGSYLP